MKPSTTAQRRRIMSTLQGDQTTKQQLAHQYSNGRTTSLSQLTYTEAHLIIMAINPTHKTKTIPPGNDQRRKIIAMARQLGWELYDPTNNKVTADLKAIDNWCLKYGKFGLKLQQHNPDQLNQLVSQFEKVHASQLNRYNNPKT